MVVDEVIDADKIKAETIKLLEENITKGRLSLRRTMELRSFLFFAVHRGIPLSIQNITSEYLAGNHGRQNVKPLSQYVLELEQAQKQLDSLQHYIAFCEEEIQSIMESQEQ
ncbi:hypothetical protein CHH58_06470 [Terribacillus saccharophilus]|uniref:hypothetical protein n=1 Tax=Terribacillus saccharophilus TaxID=361277 RepID=UPI000BA5CD4D|nr:hypothetical protein [Terribacillus saccharophilus]PAF37832.1 hypothetical protein CHH58_06470 [Terribacillus saccharophilus]